MSHGVASAPVAFCVGSRKAQPLPHQPRPVLRVSATARLLVASQAPGNLVHSNRTSLQRPIRRSAAQWMGWIATRFTTSRASPSSQWAFAFRAMTHQAATCRRAQNAAKVGMTSYFATLPQIETVVAIGRYAQDYHLARRGVCGRTAKPSPTLSRRWREFQMRPRIFPIAASVLAQQAGSSAIPGLKPNSCPLREEVARLTRHDPTIARTRASRSKARNATT